MNRRRVTLQMLLVLQLCIASRVRTFDQLPVWNVPQVLAFEVLLQVATGAEGMRALLETEVAVTQAENALCGQAFDRDRNALAHPIYVYSVSVARHVHVHPCEKAWPGIYTPSTKRRCKETRVLW